MRGRLLAGAVALADYEILEMVLFLGIPRGDTKPRAKGLLNHFGSLAGLLSAPRPALDEADVPMRAAEAFAMVVEAAQCLAKAERIERVVLSDWDALGRYLDAPARTLRPPASSALLLNNRNQLLGECRFDDPDDPVRVARQLLQHALDRYATAAILVRNGGAMPALVTAPDTAMLAHVRRAAGAVSVAVHDMLLGAGRSVAVGAAGHR
jgi:DNA repair protein RadC